MEGFQFVYPMGLILGPSILPSGNSQLCKHSLHEIKFKKEVMYWFISIAL